MQTSLFRLFTPAMKAFKAPLFNQADRIFLWIAALFGVLYIFITPPFQAPDEFFHFYRTYQLSEGQVLATKEGNQVGGLLPRSLQTVSLPFMGLPHQPENRLSLTQLGDTLKLPLGDTGDRIFMHLSTMALYSPIPYIPSTVGVGLGKLVGLSPLALTYVGRLFNLAAWIALGYAALRITPIFRWVMLLLLLTPMSLFLAASLSADAITNGLAFVLMALVLRTAFGESETLSVRDVGAIALTTTLLALSKQAYVPLAFLWLLIPISKAKNPQRYWLWFGLVLLVSVGASLLWAGWIKPLYVPLNPFHPPESQSPDGQLAYVLAHPIAFFKVVKKTVDLLGDTWLHQFIGHLGWVDVPLPIPFVASYFGVLIGAALGDGDRKIQIHLWKKIGLGTLFVLNGLLLCLSIYLVWAPVGGTVIEGIQGRYFIPLSPALFLLFYNRRWLFLSKFSKISSHLISLYLLFSCGLTVAFLIHRYY